MYLCTEMWESMIIDGVEYPVKKTYFINIFVLLICNYVPKMSTLNVSVRVSARACLYILFVSRCNPRFFCCRKNWNITVIIYTQLLPTFHFPFDIFFSLFFFNSLQNNYWIFKTLVLFFKRKKYMYDNHIILIFIMWTFSILFAD